MGRIALLALLLAGCASAPNYVGHPVQDAMLALGPPTGSMVLPDGRKAYQWRMDRGAVGMVLPSGIVATRNQQCIVTLTVDGADTITSRTATGRRC